MHGQCAEAALGRTYAASTQVGDLVCVTMGTNRSPVDVQTATDDRLLGRITSAPLLL